MSTLEELQAETWEETLDCALCGGAGEYQISLYELSDSAEWVLIGRRVICGQHQVWLTSTASRLKHWQRMVVWRL